MHTIFGYVGWEYRDAIDLMNRSSNMGIGL